MTQVPKSDAQLDAEAAAPKRARDLGAVILHHRLLYVSETGILRLHQRNGESGLGPPFSAQFENYLEAVYVGFPWTAALVQLQERCAQGHTGHQRPHWPGGLCFALVALVVCANQPLPAARRVLELADEAKTRRTLDAALRSMEQRLIRRPREAPTPTYRAPQRHDQLGLHQVECPQCRLAVAR